VLHRPDMEFSWKTLTGVLAENEAGVAVCTIVDKHGSVPRGIGTRMLVQADGSISGTIGGGIGEHDIIVQARQAISNQESLVVRISLAGEQGLDSPAICGGWFQTLISYWSRKEQPLAENIAAKLDAGEPITLLEVVSGDSGYPTGSGRHPGSLTGERNWLVPGSRISKVVFVPWKAVGFWSHRSCPNRRW